MERLERLGGTQENHQVLGLVHLIISYISVKTLSYLPFAGSNPGCVGKSESYMCGGENARFSVGWSLYQMSGEEHGISKQE